MLRNIQEKIILIFLVIGILIIGTIGTINYIKIQGISEQAGENIETYNLLLADYQNQIKIVTLSGVLIFAFICVGVRGSSNKKNNFTYNRIN